MRRSTHTRLYHFFTDLNNPVATSDDLLLFSGQFLKIHDSAIHLKDYVVQLKNLAVLVDHLSIHGLSKENETIVINTNWMCHL